MKGWWKSNLWIPRNETVQPPYFVIYFQDQSVYFAAAKHVDRSWEYNNRSQTYECGSWDWDRAWKGKEYINGIFVAVCDGDLPPSHSISRHSSRYCSFCTEDQIWTSFSAIYTVGEKFSKTITLTALVETFYRPVLSLHLPFFKYASVNEASKVGCLRKRLLEFRESRNFIRKWSYFREISSDFVYFRITFYTTFSYNLVWFPFDISYRNKKATPYTVCTYCIRI